MSSLTVKPTNNQTLAVQVKAPKAPVGNKCLAVCGGLTISTTLLSAIAVVATAIIFAVAPLLMPLIAFKAVLLTGAAILVLSTFLSAVLVLSAIKKRAIEQQKLQHQPANVIDIASRYQNNRLIAQNQQLTNQLERAITKKGEAEQRIGSLLGQMDEKTEELNQKQMELEVVLTQDANEQVKQLKEQINGLNALIQNKQTLLDNFNQECMKNASEREINLNQISSLEKNAKALVETKKNYEERLFNFEKKVNALTEENEVLSNQVGNLTNGKSLLAEQMKILQSEKEKISKELDEDNNNAKKLKELQENIMILQEKLTQGLENHKAEKINLENEVKNLTQANERLTKLSSQSGEEKDKEISSLANQLEELKKEKNSASQELNEANQTIQKLKLIETNLTNLNNDYVSKTSNNEKTIQELRDAKHNHENALTQLTQKLKVANELVSQEKEGKVKLEETIKSQSETLETCDLNMTNLKKWMELQDSVKAEDASEEKIKLQERISVLELDLKEAAKTFKEIDEENFNYVEQINGFKEEIKNLKIKMNNMVEINENQTLHRRLEEKEKKILSLENGSPKRSNSSGSLIPRSNSVGTPMPNRTNSKIDEKEKDKK